jgi:hypothetical protein
MISIGLACLAVLLAIGTTALTWDRRMERADRRRLTAIVDQVQGQHAHAYRMPTGRHADVFAPTRVYWWYGASPVWTLRAVLTLPEPGGPEAPNTLTPVPPGLGIPGNRMPVKVRRRDTVH